MTESENRTMFIGWFLATIFFFGIVGVCIYSRNARHSDAMSAKEKLFDKEQEARKPDPRFVSSGSEPMGVKGPWVSVFTDSKTKRQYLFVYQSGSTCMVLMPEEKP